MFSLIITIISIALVAALAVATIYYGGSAFTQGTAKANAATLVSAAQQVSGANTLFANDTGARATDIADLQPSYLQSAPTLPSGVSAFDLTSATQVSATGVADSVCKAVVASVTGETVDAAVIAATATAGRAYDCFGTAGANTFVFKG